MAKFKSPTGSNEIWISQTTHGESASNPNDLSKQRAIDISMNEGVNFFSVCSGVVELTTTSGGGYISIIPDNANFRILYVHTKDWTVSKGQRVQVGQVLGKIQTLSTGSHLHFGLKNISGVAPHPEPMEYFDRGLVFRTKYADIKKVWFIGENLNWGLFKDLSYNNTNMDYKIGDYVTFTDGMNLRGGAGDGFNTIGEIAKGAVGKIKDGPRASQNKLFYGKGSNKNVNDGYTWRDIQFLNVSGWVAETNRLGKSNSKTLTNTDGSIPKPPQEPEKPVEPSECQKQVESLKEQLKGLESKLGACESKRKLLEAEKSDLGKEIKRLDTELEQIVEDIKELMDKNELLEGENKRLVLDREELVTEMSRLKENCNKNTIEKIVDWLRNVLTKIVGGE